MPTDYCNMNCIYCFNNRKDHCKNKVMSLETLNKIFAISIPYYEKVNFIWHGGEPTSMGIEFYKHVVAIQKSFNSNNTTIENSLQSNLTLLDDEFASFLLENGFRIGGSFDGLKNDLTRHNTEKILNGREIVIRNGGKVGFICVVQNKNIDCLIEDYEWFKSRGINYTLNPYMCAPPYENDPLFVSSQRYVEKICELFDYWISDSKCNINISYFEEYVNYILFAKKSLCCYNSCLGKHIGIHYNGDIYNCNRDFPDKYSFGNIYDYTDIHECFMSPGFQLMAEHAVIRRNYCKDHCEIYDFCVGGCNSSAITRGDLTKVNDYICEINKKVYRYIEERLNRLIDIYEQDNKDKNSNLNPWIYKQLCKYKKN